MSLTPASDLGESLERAEVVLNFLKERSKVFWSCPESYEQRILRSAYEMKCEWCISGIPNLGVYFVTQIPRATVVCEACYCASRKGEHLERLIAIYRS